MNPAYPWREAPEAEFGVIGDPVGHSLSPRMHTAIYRALRLTYRYTAIQVPAGEVAEALAHLWSIGYQGINVTVPHKEEALAWAKSVEPLARQVRAANTLRLANKSCINTDAPGFLDTLADFHPTQRRALLLGAGGSARAVAIALLSAGYELWLYNRTLSKAEALAEEIGIPIGQVLAEADPTRASLIVNTTSASLHNAELPVLWDRAEPGALAYDLMYAREPTPFLKSAERVGLNTVDGLNMLVAQGARSFEWWLGIEAPRGAMLQAIR
jgi:shikimate dehydrogenase